MHRTEGDFARNREIGKLLRDHDWRDGLIGDAAYTASLIGLGYMPRDAETELNLLKLDAPARVDAQLERSRSWLQQRRG